MTRAEQGASPGHIAIIMDGNGRWARKRGLPRHAGHKAGLKAARNIIEHCVEVGTQALTLFTFSSENWRRPAGEVSRLMELFLAALNKDIKELHGNGIRVRFVGDLSPFTSNLRQGMDAAERLTSPNRKLELNVAVGYGGRWDIVHAARNIAGRICRGEYTADELDEEKFAQAMMLYPSPDPDLFIRTGGEQRISNFLLWNLAYSELYFTDILWPDFDPASLDEALAWYSARQRRFGMTSDQLEGETGA